jgi:hypothetical protein
MSDEVPLDERLRIDPRIGGVIQDMIKDMTGRDVHVILIAAPCAPVDEENVRLGQPTFITSMEPEDMCDFLMQIGGCFAMGNPLVHGGKPN